MINYALDCIFTKTSPASDFGVSKIKVMHACMNKLQYFGVRRIGALAVLEHHHSDTDALAPIQYIIRSESARFPEDLTDAASGAAGSIRNRTNLGELSNEDVHQALRDVVDTAGNHAIDSPPRLESHSGEQLD